MDRKYFQSYWPGIAWFFIMSVLLFMPGTDVPEPDNWLKNIYFDKWVHAGIFAVFTGLLLYAHSAQQKSSTQLNLQRFLMVLCIIAWALATEYIQRDFCISRGFDLWDWGADSLGIGIAYAYRIYVEGKRKKIGGAVKILH